MKQRILQFVDYKAISVRKFCDEVGISHSLLGNNSALGSDKLEKISAKYDELNMDWVVKGRGEMIFKAQQKMYDVPDLITYANDAKPVAIEVLKDEVTDLQRKLIRCLEEKESQKASYEKIYSNVPTEVKTGK